MPFSTFKLRTITSFLWKICSHQVETETRIFKRNTSKQVYSMFLKSGSRQPIWGVSTVRCSMLARCCRRWRAPVYHLLWNWFPKMPPKTISNQLCASSVFRHLQDLCTSTHTLSVCSSVWGWRSAIIIVVFPRGGETMKLKKVSSATLQQDSSRTDRSRES